MTQTDQLVRDFLARGGKINRLPETRVRRDTLTPEIVRKRDILSDVLARAGVEV